MGTRPIAVGARADGAGALGEGPALLGMPARGMLMDAAWPGGATLPLVPEAAAELRTGEGVWPRGCCGGGTTARGIDADTAGCWVLLASSALGSDLIGGRFDLWVLGNTAGVASTGEVFRPGLDPSSAGTLGGTLSCGEGLAFGCSSGSGVEVLGAPGLAPGHASGLMISVLTRNAARRMLITSMAPTRSRAERGHDRRAARPRERA